MSEAGVRTWASEAFPDLPSDVIRRWLEEEGLRHVEPGGDVLFFSNDPLDRLLRHFHAHPEPVRVEELQNFIDGDDRNIRIRVDRDPRFIEDEFKRVLPAKRARSSAVRVGGSCGSMPITVRRMPIVGRTRSPCPSSSTWSSAA